MKEREGNVNGHAGGNGTIWCFVGASEAERECRCGGSREEFSLGGKLHLGSLFLLLFLLLLHFLHQQTFTIAMQLGTGFIYATGKIFFLLNKIGCVIKALVESLTK